MTTTKTGISEEIFEFSIEGDCTAEKILAVIQQHYGKIGGTVLWNFAATKASMSSEEMIAIANTAKKRATHSRAAYVCPQDLEFGLFRMYQTHAEIEGIATEMKVFRTREEAVSWLQE